MRAHNSLSWGGEAAAVRARADFRFPLTLPLIHWSARAFIARRHRDFMLNDLFRRKSIERILRESEQSRMENEYGGSLKRALTAIDLTAFGIAAIIGVGIFGTVGQAAFHGGPAVS